MIIIKAKYDKNNQIKYITKVTKYKDESGEQEIQETEIFKKYYGNDQFWKLFLNDFLQAMGLISNSKQLDVILYIMKNLQSENNIFIGTYKNIEKETNISYKTIATTFKKMLENNFLEKKQNGVYQVSAKILIKGSQIKKNRLIINYENTK